VETKREADGLAMSSRNRYLSEEQRSKSTLIFKGLSTAKASFESGIKDKAQLIARFVETIAVVQEMKIQYAEILRSQDLSNPGEQLVDGPFVFAAAVLYGDVRLIDNVEFGV